VIQNLGTVLVWRLDMLVRDQSYIYLLVDLTAYNEVDEASASASACEGVEDLEHIVAILEQARVVDLE